jgi:hypothetical protein
MFGGPSFFGGPAVFGGPELYYRAGAVAPPSLLRVAVFRRLAGSAALAAVVGTRIHPWSLPRAWRGPACTYYVGARDWGHDLGAPNGTSDGRVRVSIFSRLQSDCDAGVEAVRALFDGFRGPVAGVEFMYCKVLDSSDLPEPPADGSDATTYQVAVEILARHRVAKPNS